MSKITYLGVVEKEFDPYKLEIEITEEQHEAILITALDDAEKKIDDTLKKIDGVKRESHLKSQKIFLEDFQEALITIEDERQ